MKVQLAILVVVCAVSFGVDVPCKGRDYGQGSVVCVCDENYCDTLSSPVRSNNIAVYTTSKSGARFSSQSKSFTQTPQIPKNGNVLGINDNIKYQEIIGWGGAFTDSTGINILSLNPKAQDNLLRSYFSTSGLEYNLGRVPIGGTDFSTRKYTYDDGNQTDFNLKNFKLAPEDYNYKIPIIQRAKALQANLKLFGASWYAPDWLLDKNTNYIRNNLRQVWANYVIKFLEAYSQSNVDFWAVSPGNEPYFINLGINTGFVNWLPQPQTNWIVNNLTPALKSSQFSDVKIIILDDQAVFLPLVPDAIFSNILARKYVDGIAIHWYYNTDLTPYALQETQRHFPEKFILSTEACIMLSGGSLSLGSWDNAEKYAVDIIRDVNNHVTGWVDWNLALDTNGGPNWINNYVDSPIIVNATSGEFYKQPMFYILGHFSKFIPAGSRRIQVISGKPVPNVDVTAFQRPDLSKAVVLLNKGNVSTEVAVFDGERGLLELNLEQKSITTIVYW